MVAAEIESAGRGVRPQRGAWYHARMTIPFLSRGDHREQLAQADAVGRLGRPDGIAAVALFLASDDASFIHGAAIVVDGEMTIGVG